MKTAQLPDKDLPNRFQRPLGGADLWPACGRDARAPRQAIAILHTIAEKPLRGAPCNALQRFLKRGLG